MADNNKLCQLQPKYRVFVFWLAGSIGGNEAKLEIKGLFQVGRDYADLIEGEDGQDYVDSEENEVGDNLGVEEIGEDNRDLVEEKTVQDYANRVLIESNPKVCKDGERWHETQDCNSCSCNCGADGKPMCICNRIGCGT